MSLLCLSLVVINVAIAAIAVMFDIVEKVVVMVLIIGVVVAARDVFAFVIDVLGIVIVVCAAHVVLVSLLSLSWPW